MKLRLFVVMGLLSLIDALACDYRKLSGYSQNPSAQIDGGATDAAARDSATDRTGASDVADARDTPDAGAIDRPPAGSLAEGSACAGAMECLSGQCVDGVCCESACRGQCEACNGGTPGKCLPVMGAPRGTRTPCVGTDACKGQCNGVDAVRCQYPGAEHECAPGSCANGMASTASVCTGAGACSTAATATCASSLCADTTKCAGGCDATHPCSSGRYCDTASGACLTQKANGIACLSAVECTSQNCVDGVCCESACAGQCQACAEAGMPGKCVAVSGPPRGVRMACAGTNDACRGTCNGTQAMACAYPGTTAVCAASSCAGGKLTAASVCDGVGGCATPAITSCRSNQCADAARCLDACTAALPCGAGTYCDATGVCQPKKANGTVCVSTMDCTSGNCVDGVCCDSSCVGQCESCSEPTTPGRCTPVMGTPRGTRTACAGQAPCKGTCGGTDGTKCKFPAAETQCAAGTCTAGSATPPTVCNGAGACTPPTPMQCSSNLCAASVCSGGCGATSPCPTGQFCTASGACSPKKAAAAVCQTGIECTSGNCVDGVCCDLACTGQCEACAEAGKVGQCVPVMGGPRGTRAACAGTTCRGTCDGTLRKACLYPGSATVCTAASCANAMGTTASVCNGAGACTAATTTTCRANQCLNATTCLVTCSATQPCAGATFCDANGVCQPKKTGGGACLQGTECANGSCVDGVCCETACTGPCLSCGLTGTAGLCRPIVNQDDPANCPGTCDATGVCKSKRGQTCATTAGGCVAGTLCADNFCCDRACTGPCEVCSATPGTCTFLSGAAHTGRSCGGTGLCAGTCQAQAACAFPGATTSCRDASCSASSGTSAASCDGAGNCPAPVVTPCRANQCLNATMCLTTCGTQPCTGATFCDGNGICQPKKAMGATCVLAAECANGSCADGFCCSRPCNGACEACNVTPGTCTFLSGAPHAGRVCAGTGACVGTCNGLAATCTLPGATTSCRTATCTGGSAISAGVCDGLGTCSAAVTTPCAPFTCGPTACKSSCAADSDCLAGSFCYTPNGTCHVGVAKVVAGNGHTCALLKDNRVFCWGQNVSNELGNGDVQGLPSPTPVRVAGLGSIKDIVAGVSHTCVLTTDGGVTCWGLNQLGELGIGTETNPVPPRLVQVSTSAGVALSGVNLLAAGGESACAVTATSTFCWGENFSNWHGAASAANPLVFATSLPNLGVPPTLVVASGFSGFGVEFTGGQVCPWGYNDSAQVSGSTLNIVYPNPMLQCQTFFPAALEVTAGRAHICARTVGGTVWCWGSNFTGQAGSGRSETTVPPPATFPVLNVVASRVVAGGVFSCAIGVGNTTVSCWGFNGFGELGNGDTSVAQSGTPVTVNLGLPAGLTVTDLGSGPSAAHICAILSNGSLRCWGANDAGQIGNGSTDANGVSTPVQVIANW